MEGQISGLNTDEFLSGVNSEKKEFIKRIQDRVKEIGASDLLKLIVQTNLKDFDQNFQSHVSDYLDVMIAFKKHKHTKEELHVINSKMSSVQLFLGFISEIKQSVGEKNVGVSINMDKSYVSMEKALMDLLAEGMNIDNEDDLNLLKEYGFSGQAINKSSIGKKIKLDEECKIAVMENEKSENGHGTKLKKEKKGTEEGKKVLVSPNPELVALKKEYDKVRIIPIEKRTPEQDRIYFTELALIHGADISLAKAYGEVSMIPWYKQTKEERKIAYTGGTLIIGVDLIRAMAYGEAMITPEDRQTKEQKEIITKVQGYIYKKYSHIKNIEIN